MNVILDKLTEYLTCPQTKTLMTDPVITEDGTTIERSAYSGDGDVRSNLKIKQMLEVRQQLTDKLAQLTDKRALQNHEILDVLSWLGETLTNICSCSITYYLMKDPVVTADGQCYERKAINQWLAQKSTSPLTNEPLANYGVKWKDLYPNNLFKTIIETIHRLWVNEASLEEISSLVATSSDALAAGAEAEIANHIKDGHWKQTGTGEKVQFNLLLETDSKETSKLFYLTVDKIKEAFVAVIKQQLPDQDLEDKEVLDGITVEMHLNSDRCCIEMPKKLLESARVALGGDYVPIPEERPVAGLRSRLSLDIHMMDKDYINIYFEPIFDYMDDMYKINRNKSDDIKDSLLTLQEQPCRTNLERLVNSLRAPTHPASVLSNACATLWVVFFGTERGLKLATTITNQLETYDNNPQTNNSAGSNLT